MWFLANTFRVLSAAKPELTNGLYTYAESGFGKFIGFFVAYGYWICNCIALAAYSVLIMSTMNYFIPIFEGGNTIPAIIVGSVISWAVFVLTTRGARQTSSINLVGTIGKIVPVIVFIMAIITIFKFSVFLDNFWGVSSSGQALAFSLENVLPQARNTMMITLWLFIGIEGAVVVSGRATSQAAVRRSTMIGFVLVLVMYVLVSTLPFGVYTQSDLADMANPSTAAIMLDAFGPWGEILMNVGVMISVLTSWLVWLLMLGEMPLAAARNGTFPKYFDSENKNHAPVRSLLITTLIVQVVLIFSYFAGNAWNVLITITGVMCLPCYLFSTLYLCKVVRKDYPKGIFAGKGYALATGIIGTGFAVWLLYAAGLNYLVLACILYALGIPLYIAARKQNGQEKPFAARYDKMILAVMLTLGAAGVIYSILQFL